MFYRGNCDLIHTHPNSYPCFITAIYAPELVPMFYYRHIRTRTRTHVLLPPYTHPNSYPCFITAIKHGYMFYFLSKTCTIFLFYLKAHAKLFSLYIKPIQGCVCYMTEQIGVCTFSLYICNIVQTCTYFFWLKEFGSNLS